MVTFSSEISSHLAPIIWELLPAEIKDVESVAVVYVGRMFFRLVSCNLFHDT